MTARAVPWPSAGTQVVGVVGYPVAHSLSPLLHNTAFAALGLDWVSVGLPVAHGALADALAGVRALELRGVSVTMPHKEAAAALVDRRTDVATRLEAVNCVAREGDELVGHDTDGEGFLASLRRGAGFEPAGRRCLVVGSGGAARAVVAALGDAGASEVVVVSRARSRAERAAALAGAAGRAGLPAEAAHMDLVVNATPIGMAGTVTEHAPSPLDPGSLGPGQVVADLVYHPQVTPLLAAAGARGATTLGGLGMLVHQAAAQLARWTGRDVPLEVMWDAAQAEVRRGGAVEDR